MSADPSRSPDPKKKCVKAASTSQSSERVIKVTDPTRRQGYNDFYIRPPVKVAMDSNDDLCMLDMVVEYKMPDLLRPGNKITAAAPCPRLDIEVDDVGSIIGIETGENNGKIIRCRFKKREVIVEEEELILFEVGGDLSWHSKDDPLSGPWSTEYVLPPGAFDINVMFDVRLGKKIREWDRPHRRRLSHQQEIFSIPNDVIMDAHFALEGVAWDCRVIRGFNSVPGQRPCPWEYWPDYEQRPGAPVFEIFSALQNNAEITPVLVAVIRDLIAVLMERRVVHKKAYFGFGATKTVTAGVTIGAAATIWFPPVSLGLGIAGTTLTAVGTASEMYTDHHLNPKLRRLVNKWRLESGTFEIIMEMARILAANEPGDDERLLRRLRNINDGVSYTAGAGQAILAVSKLSIPGRLLLREAEVAQTISKLGAGLRVAGRALTILGAVTSTVDCALSWKITKPNTAVLNRTIEALQNAQEALAAVPAPAAPAPQPLPVPDGVEPEVAPDQAAIQVDDDREVPPRPDFVGTPLVELVTFSSVSHTSGSPPSSPFFLSE